MDTTTAPLDQLAAAIGVGFVVAIMGLMVLVYFLPSLVAHDRHHHNAAAILVLNLLAGWTFFGWVACLVWACTQVRRPVPPPLPVSHLWPH